LYNPKQEIPKIGIAVDMHLDGRYHSPSGEAAGCDPCANSLGTTAGCFIDGL